MAHYQNLPKNVLENRLPGPIQTYLLGETWETCIVRKGPRVLCVSQTLTAATTEAVRRRALGTGGGDNTTYQQTAGVLGEFQEWGCLMFECGDSLGQQGGRLGPRKLTAWV